mmetsp:Transcript_7649/g.6775  ORF Transcript_7649/g.6775 Transcript_7649/m.6775 type:complete len:108 (-) Transcript_7649:19-342(-)
MKFLNQVISRRLLEEDLDLSKNVYETKHLHHNSEIIPTKTVIHNYKTHLNVRYPSEHPQLNINRIKIRKRKITIFKINSLNQFSTIKNRSKPIHNKSSNKSIMVSIT